MFQVANVTPEYSDERHVTLSHFFVCTHVYIHIWVDTNAHVCIHIWVDANARV